MEHYTVKRLALVLAVQAEIEGMKIQNQIDVNSNLLPSFEKTHFEAKAMELSNLAHAHDYQL